MEIIITGRNIDLDPDVKDTINRKVGKLGKYYPRLFKSDVILEEEKERKNTEIIISLRRNKIVAKGVASDFYASLDVAITSAKKQLRRLNNKAVSKKRRSVMKKIMGPFGKFRSSYQSDDIVEMDEV